MAGRHCTNCPYRIINEKYCYIEGIGNADSKQIIVLPYLNTKDKDIINSSAFKTISELYSNMFSRDILDDYYITAYIKCRINLQYPIDDYVRLSCYNYIHREFAEHQFINCIFFGSAGMYLCGKTPSKKNIIYRTSNASIFVNFSPYVIRYETFKELYISKLTYIFKAFMYNDYRDFEINNM